MEGNVTSLKPATALRSSSAPRRKPFVSRETRLLRRQRMAAHFVTAVGVAFTLVSLIHLTEGLNLVSHRPIWECALVGLGIDFSYLSMDVAHFAASTDSRRAKVQAWARFGIPMALAFSASMNVFAFVSGAETLVDQVASGTAGIIVSSMIYICNRVASILRTGR